MTNEGDVYMWEGWSKPLEPGQCPPRTAPTPVPAAGSQLPPLVPVNHPLPGAAFQGVMGQSPPASAAAGFLGGGVESKGPSEPSPGDSGRKRATESGSRRKQHKKSWRSFEQIRPERWGLICKSCCHMLLWGFVMAFLCSHISAAFLNLDAFIDRRCFLANFRGAYRNLSFAFHPNCSVHLPQL